MIVQEEPERLRSPIYSTGYDPCGPLTEARTEPLAPDPSKVEAYNAKVAEQLKAAKAIRANPTGVREDEFEGIPKPKEIRRGTGNPYPTGPAPVPWIDPKQGKNNE